MHNQQINLLDVFFERMPMGIVILDRELRLQRFNPTWAGFVERYSRATAAQIVPGARFYDLAPGAEAATAALFERVLGGETVRVDALRIETEGIVSYWDAVLTPLYDGDEVIGLLIVTTDATERVLSYQTLERRVAERTHELERRREVAEGLRDILAVLNSSRSLEEMLDLIVAQAERQLEAEAGAIFRLLPDGATLTIQAACGLPAEYAAGIAIPVGQGAVGRSVATRRPVPVPDLAALIAGDETSLAPEQRALIEQIAGRYQSLLAAPLITNDAVYGALVLYYPRRRDFSAEEIELTVASADQAALAIQNARLRQQAEQHAVAAERNRLAHDLHDSVTQTLFSAGLIAEVLPRLWERQPEEARRRLQELRQLTRGALAEMRTLLLELRPATLTDVGLDELLRQLAEGIAGRARVPVELRLDESCHLPPDVQIALYRIAQEALNNVAKHAAARHATVELRCRPEQVELRIGDDGCGFDLSGVPPTSLGLNIMRERAAEIGAALRIESQPAHGTYVGVTWPRKKEQP